MKLKFNDTAGQPFDTDHDSLGKPAAISCLGQMFAWLHFFYAWPPFGMQSREGDTCHSPFFPHPMIFKVFLLNPILLITYPNFSL